ncbi:MAG: DUF4249 domain-containing protein [Bacteroidia bacterium]|nr:DUF4249 domain-containing protein [Bacteroidia bacterium]
MRVQRYIRLTIFSLLVGCKTDVELIAPEARERLVVYAILHTDADSQYVRVGRLFVTREDAAAYAARTDLSVSAVVRLSDGQREWIGIPETVLKNPSQPFYPVQVVYRLPMRPLPRQRYALSIEVPDNPLLNVHASTVVPSPPYIARPESTVLIANQLSYPTIDLTKRYVLQFFPQFNTQLPSLAGGYELSFIFFYGEIQGSDTVWRTLRIGPRRLAPTGPASQSYTIQEKELLRTAYANLNKPGVRYVYDNSRFSQAWSLQITALDTALYNYLRVNDPATTDFTTVKPEYTNVQGGLGIFGSAAVARRYFRIDSCSEYLLRLNDAPPPSTPCSLE